MPKTAMIMATGGIDSTVLLYELMWVQKHPYMMERGFKPFQTLVGNHKARVTGLVIGDYGQASLAHQVALLKYHAAKFGLPVHVVPVPIPPAAMRKELAEPGFVPQKRKLGFVNDAVRRVNSDKIDKRKKKEIEKELTDYNDGDYAWVQGRNAYIMLNIGTFCALNKVDYLYHAFQFDRAVWLNGIENVNSDTTPRFVRTMQNVFRQSFTHRTIIRSPYFESLASKSETVARGKQLLGEDMKFTYSCEYFPACGVCQPCQHIAKLRVTQVKATADIPAL